MSDLNETSIKACMERYKEYMREIRKRSDVIDKILYLNLSPRSKNDICVTGFIETDIDLAYLQLRKIIELIMYACVVANELAGIELSKKLRKSYQPKELRKILQKYNNDFFPYPVQDIKVKKGEIRSLESLTEGFSSFEDLETAHGKCGDILHAKRNYTYSDTHKLLNNCNNTLNSIKTLLNHHWITIDNDNKFAVIMSSYEDQEVKISLMGKICSTDDPQAALKILEAQNKYTHETSKK